MFSIPAAPWTANSVSLLEPFLLRENTGVSVGVEEEHTTSRNVSPKASQLHAEAQSSLKTVT